MREILHQIIAFPAALAAIVAALLAFISGVLGPLVQLRIGKMQASASLKSAEAAMLTAQNVGSREIARMRLAWMEKLRDTLAVYHSILMALDDNKEETDEQSQKLVRLGTELDLLLNQQDPLQKRLWEISDKIYNCDDTDERQAMDPELIEAGRAVLKGEWEKIKAEMRGEQFKTGEQLSP